MAVTDPQAARALEAAFDRVAFERARCRVLAEQTEREGIGRLSEKSLHRILKLWLEPDESRHEVPLLGSVADIYNDSGAIEIQTRAFSRLEPKLRKFLPVSPVTVVYPLAAATVLHWIDRGTGAICPPRKSAKHATVYDSLYELYNIRSFLSDPNLTLMLVFLQMEEYRFRSLDARGRTRDPLRAERIPNAIGKVLVFRKREDYLALLPDGLPPCFTAPMITKAISPRFRYSFSALRILLSLGLIEPCGKLGRANAYRLAEKSETNAGSLC